MNTVEKIKDEIEAMSNDNFMDYFTPFSYYNSSLEHALSMIAWNEWNTEDIAWYSFESWYDENLYIRTKLNDVYILIKENEDVINEILSEKFMDCVTDMEAEDHYDPYEDFVSFEFLGVAAYFYYNKFVNYNWWRTNIPTVFKELI